MPIACSIFVQGVMPSVTIESDTCKQVDQELYQLTVAMLWLTTALDTEVKRLWHQQPGQPADAHAPSHSSLSTYHNPTLEASHREAHQKPSRRSMRKPAWEA